MDLKRQSRIAAVALAVLSVLSCADLRAAEAGPSAQRSAKPRIGFLDFTLRRINPSDKDYGQCIDQGRAVLIQATVRNRYFWANLIALSALGCLLVIIIFQHRSGSRREWITAEVLAQFEHSLRRSKALFDEATQKNQALKEALTRMQESKLQSIPARFDSAEIGGSAAANTGAGLRRVAAESPTRTSSGKAAAIRNEGCAAGVESTNQMTLFKADATLIMKVNALEQQLAHAEEQKRELRRQLNEAGRKLGVEQEMNRTLKGA